MNIKNIKFIEPFYKGKKLFFGGSKVYVNR